MKETIRPQNLGHNMTKSECLSRKYLESVPRIVQVAAHKGQFLRDFPMTLMSSPLPAGKQKLCPDRPQELACHLET